MALSSKALLISLVLTAMVSGSISCIASLTIIVMIFRSNLKLSTIYRRLIFGMSIFDLMQSFAQVTGALFMPKGTTWSAIGNNISCSVTGLLATLGICGAVFYSLSISVYFLCVVKFEMNEDKIKKYVEPFLHAVPITYSLVIATYIASVHYFKPGVVGCWINGDSEYHTEVLQWLGGYGPFFSVFIFNCAILAMMWWTVYSQSKLMSQLCMRGSMTMLVQSPSSHRDSEMYGSQGRRGSISSIPSSLKTFIDRLKSSSRGDETTRGQSSGAGGGFPSRGSSNNLGPLAARLSRPSRGTMQMLREISTRATAYIIGYIMTYIFSLIHRMMELRSAGSTPPAIFILARFFIPLQGFFNILIYTYPHVLTYRRNYNGTPWVRAFWEVIKSGGDCDQVRSTSMPAGRLRNRRSKFSRGERRRSLRNEPAVLDIDESFIANAKWIQSSYNNKESDLVDVIVNVDIEDGDCDVDCDVDCSGNHDDSADDNPDDNPDDGADDNADDGADDGADDNADHNHDQMCLHHVGSGKIKEQSCVELMLSSNASCNV